MKVVMISNLNLETIEERIAMLDDQKLIDLSQDDAQLMADRWNKLNAGDYSMYWAVIKPDDYVLWRGMADLVGEPVGEPE